MNNDKLHLPFLDNIRGIAILSVFFVHCLGLSFGFDRLQWRGLFPNFDVPKSFLTLLPLTYGYLGVTIFFVVSGFCIHLSHERSKEKGWLHFANSRFFRLYPAYLFVLGIFFFIYPWGSLDIHGARFKQLWTHLLMIHNFNKETFYGIDGPLWSLAVEIQLYAIYPILILFAGRFGWKYALIIVGTINIVILSFSSINGVLSEESLPYLIIYSPFAYWLCWSIGAYLCHCILNNYPSRLFSMRFDLLCLISFSLSLFKPTEPFSGIGFSLLTAIAIERLMTKKWKLSDNYFCVKIWNHLGLLGIVSYSFYLFHYPIMKLNVKLFNLFPFAFTDPLIMFSAYFAWYPAILLLSYLIYRLIERPSVALGKVAYNTISGNGGTVNA